jgi:hypothetical protein
MTVGFLIENTLWYIWRNLSLHTIEIPVHPCLQQLFTIAKLWNQPRCPSTNEWIKKMWYNTYHGV